MKTNPCHCCGGTGRELNSVAVGAEMRALRKRRSISLRLMATRLGLSAAYVSDLELGRRAWNKGLIRRFKADLLK